MLLGSYIERIIREAQADGAFDNLPGKGRPLEIDSRPGAVTSGMLKGAGALPEWLELRRRIEDHEGHIEAFLAGYALEYSEARKRIPEREARDQSSGVVRLLMGTASQRRAAIRRTEAVEALNRRRDVALARYALLLREWAQAVRQFNSLVPYDERRLAVPELESQLMGFIARFPRVEIDRGGVLKETERTHTPAELVSGLQDEVKRVSSGTPSGRSAAELSRLLESRRQGRRD